MSNPPPTQELHVIFGTGPVGQATAHALLNMGKRVRLINRSGRAPQGLLSQVEVVRGDAYDVNTVAALTQGATSVYQAAQPPYNEWTEKFPPLQQAILDGVARSAAKLIVVENLYGYGDTNGQPITEGMPLRPHTKKGRVRAQMSEALLAAHTKGQIRVAMGRASNFLSGNYDILRNSVLEPAAKGKAANVLGRMDVPHSFTYVPDFGRALAILGTHDEALGKAWHVPSPTPITQMDLLRRIYTAMDQPMKIRRAGRGLLRVLGLFNPMMREVIEMLYEWEKPFILDSRPFVQTFGLQPTPWEQLIPDMLAVFHQNITI